MYIIFLQKSICLHDIFLYFIVVAFFANSNSVSQGLISSCVFLLIVLCCFVS